MFKQGLDGNGTDGFIANKTQSSERCHMTKCYRDSKEWEKVFWV